VRLRENSRMANLQVCSSCGGTIPEGSDNCPRCFAETIDSPITPAGSSVAPAPPAIAAYRIVRLLGKGGMGAVYLAEDNTLNRPVAIKIISEKQAQDTHGRNRFLREARAMATIDNPHVIRVHSFGEFSGQPYIVMEYVDGTTLAERIKHEGPLPVNEALRILRYIVDALEAAWEKQIVHRDIKPSNILVDKKGRIRVADFGLARPVQLADDASLTQSGSVVGTPHYISPEQAQGQTVDFRSDIYSLGVVLYEMLVAERPFEGTTPFSIVNKHLNTPMPSPKQKRPELPDSIVSLVYSMTRKKADKRPSSYSQLREKIDSISNRHATGKSVFTKARVTVPAAILVLISGIAIWFQQSSQTDAPPETKRLSRPSPVSTPPTRATAIVTINVLPWARVKLTPLTKGISLPVIPEKERITPCSFSLPEGEYSVELSNDSVLQPVQKTIKIQSGAANSFVFTMPAYDPRKAFAKIRGTN